MRLFKPQDLIIIIYFSIVFYASYYFSNTAIYNFANNNFQNYEIVASRYNEDILWFNDDPFNEFKVICYNKGPTDISKSCIAPNCKVVKLPNVGRESHTYLYHIISNYDNLAPITVFLPGSCVSAPHKYDIAVNVIKLINKTENTVFYGSKFEDVCQDLYDFTIDAYFGGSELNNKINSDHGLKLSSIRPYGKWFENYFGNTKTEVVCFFGIFAVSKDHILQHPKEYYINLIKCLDDSPGPETGHYMERSWGAVFYPYSKSCIHYTKET